MCSKHILKVNIFTQVAHSVSLGAHHLRLVSITDCHHDRQQRRHFTPLLHQ